MLSYSDAYDIIKKNLSEISLFTEYCRIENCLGRTLAEDIKTDINMPSFNNSAMDGFAIKFEQNIKFWKVIGEIKAGNFNDKFQYDENCAVSIMTGGKVPDFCDTIIPIEDVIVKDHEIRLKSAVIVKKGNHIRLDGADIKIDDTAIHKNTVLKPNNLTLAVACGKSELKVYSPLKIGILTTGDELVDFTELPDNDKIRATNHMTLFFLIKESNMEPMYFGRVKDNKEELRKSIEIALNSDIDILITSGAVSAGKYDFIREVLFELGSEEVFWKVNIKPGKPLLFSKYKKSEKNILIFGLPGNPVSTFVNYSIFLKPILNELLYGTKIPNLQCILESKITIKDDKRHFINGLYKYDPVSGQYTVKKLEGQSSGNIPTLGKSNCLIVFEETKRSIEKGDIVECIVI